MPSDVMGLGRIFGRPSKPAIVILAALLLAGLGLLDYVTSPEIAFAFFYLFPITLATWYVGRRAGLIFSGLGALTYLAANLRWIWVYTHRVFFYWNVIISLGFFVVVTLIVAELKRSLEQALSQSDFLTGVGNRRAFYQQAELEKNRARRYLHPLTLAYLDLDNFKQVNDRYGHQVGDLLLHSVAQTLLNSIRQTDLVARMGGDEFALLLPETGPEAAQVVVGKIREALMELMHKSGWPVTFSIGVVTFLSAPDSLETMMQQADDVMYSVKSSGKNQIAQRVE